MRLVDEIANCAMQLAKAATDLARLAGDERADFAVHRDAVIQLRQHCEALHAHLDQHKQETHPGTN
jgi:hypothetical protein